MVSSFSDFLMFAALCTSVNSFTLETASGVNRRNYASRISTLLDGVYFYVILELNIRNLKRKRKVNKFSFEKYGFQTPRCMFKSAATFLSSIISILFISFIIQLGFNPRQGIKFSYGGKRETDRRIYAREKKKEKSRAELKIRQGMTQAGFSLQSAA